MNAIQIDGQPLRSLADLLLRRLEQTPDEIAFQYKQNGRWTRWSWAECGTHFKRVARGLKRGELQQGERCAILMRTRMEWITVDFGILLAGGATTTIYPSSTAEECAFILRDSRAKVCFVEDEEQLRKIMAIWDELPDLGKVVLLEGESNDPRVLSWSTFQGNESVGSDDYWQQEIAALGFEDLACLIYTSGTTGVPKGVVLTHGSFLEISKRVEVLVELGDDEMQLLFLPLAHVFGKVCELIALYLCVPTAVDGDITQIVENLRDVKPTVMAAVPRVFEKFYNTVVQRAQGAGPLKYKVFQWAVRVGRQTSVCIEQGEKISFALGVRRRIADRLVFSKIREVFGNRLHICLSGGAPLSEDLARFFHAAGILVLEGYGLTETAAVATVNRMESYRFGTVGRPLPGVEIKIAEDGEVMILTPSIMQGYFNRPDATAEAIRDGWFYSGDIGTLDSDGYLRITDRKKNLIVTSGGKNIAPQKLENKMKVSSSLISQVLVHGDKRNYCVALITLDEEALVAMRDGHESPLNGKSERVITQVEESIRKVNKELPRHETIKKYILLEEDFSVERGELTPSLKLKRRVIEKRYQERLDALYTQASSAVF